MLPLRKMNQTPPITQSLETNLIPLGNLIENVLKENGPLTLLMNLPMFGLNRITLRI